MEHATLMKPLFVNDMFNREGKRIRAKYIKTVSCDGAEYPLWISVGVNEKDYPRAENDTHYLYIQAGEYLIPFGDTEFDLIQRSGHLALEQELYGDFKGREAFYKELRNGKTYEESNLLIKAQIEKEEAFIAERGKDDTAQAMYLKNRIVDPAIDCYIEARDKGGKHVDFRGAAFLGDLEKCVEVSKVLREKREKEEAERRALLAEQNRKEAEEKAEAERVAIADVEHILSNGGVIKGGELAVKIADKYGIKIPLRTRGWMLNDLAEITVSEDGSMSYRYWKRSKTSTGSQKVYDILFDIQKAIKVAKTA
jgi:hypothetical protein